MTGARRLLPTGAWAALAVAEVGTRSGGAAALDESAGRVAAAQVWPHGRRFAAAGGLFDDPDGALAWIGAGRPRLRLAGLGPHRRWALPGPWQPRSIRDTPDAMVALRAAAGRGLLAHDGDPVLAAAVDGVRLADTYTPVWGACGPGAQLAKVLAWAAAAR